MADLGTLGALGGLGEALSFLGERQLKDELDSRLEKEREERAEARQIAREDRQERRIRSQPVPAQATFIERDGALFKQQRNAYGDVLDEMLASADDIDKRNYMKQKQKNELDLGSMNVEGKGLTNQLTQKRIAAEEGKLGLEQDLLRARTQQARDTGTAALIRANKTGSTRSGSDKEDSAGTMSEYANLLKKEAKDVISQYAEEDDTLTATEINRVTRQAVEQAAKFGLDPQELLEQLLEERNFGKPMNK